MVGTAGPSRPPLSSGIPIRRPAFSTRKTAPPAAPPSCAGASVRRLPDFSIAAHFNRHPSREGRVFCFASTRPQSYSATMLAEELVEVVV